MNVIFGSRLNACKSPFGAVRAGETVNFHIYPERALGVLKASLFVKKDGEDAKHYPLSWKRLEGDRDVYFVRLNIAESGLFWYHFVLHTAIGERFISRTDGGIGILGEALGTEFQLTVTTHDAKVPPWFGEGITYQIFPDRFARSEKPKSEGYRSLRKIHDNWDDVPDYLPNAQGEISNNDFFGGNFAGITEKLTYLKSLNVSAIYLNPIFEAASNHRYDTGDYMTPDPMLGSEADFKMLCAAAKKLGIRVILDGVFSHTGYDSRYFNAKGHYDSAGAYNSQSSPYSDWYSFESWPDKYSSWWGFYTLPQVNELNDSYLNYITDGQDAVVRHWLRLGASGWRLDVADELPDAFIRHIASAARQTKEDAVIIGEVWEDASNKVSYGVRRKYFLGDELHSAMNYPFREAILAFLLGGKAESFVETMETLRENYPQEIFMSLMNGIGTHDTARILTVLGAEEDVWQKDKTFKGGYMLGEQAFERAKRKLFMAVIVQFTMPGSPCIYYGDEAGMQGFEDPFNRRTYPWGQENSEIFEFYKKICAVRQASHALKKGNIRYLFAKDGIIVYKRSHNGENILVAVNRELFEQSVAIPFCKAQNLLTGEAFESREALVLTIGGESAEIFRCY